MSNSETIKKYYLEKFFFWRYLQAYVQKKNPKVLISVLFVIRKDCKDCLNAHQQGPYKYIKVPS